MHETALQLLREAAETALLRRVDDNDPLAALAQVDCIFSDIDGTLTSEGSKGLPERAINYLRRLRGAGVAIILVSGKPYEEIAPIMQALPAELHVEAIYEKGAYTLETSADGQLSKSYLLTSPSQEQAVMTLRDKLTQHWQTMSAAHAHERISLGWAGSGKHQSVVSIDIFTGDVPENYMQLTGPDRDRLKLKDPTLLSAIEAELRAFVESQCPGWLVVHLGNANFEIAPPGIEKDMAIRQTAEFKQARRVLVLGDSGNDRKMFAIRRDRDTKTAAGLVFHNPATAELVEDADFVTFGLANPYPLLDQLLAAKLPAVTR